MKDHEFKALRGTYINDNKPIFDREQAIYYRMKCIEEYSFDPTPDFPLHNVEKRHYTSAHWYAKFKYTCFKLRDEQIEKERKEKIKVIGSCEAATQKEISSVNTAIL